MRWRVLLINTVVLAGITWVAVLGTEKQAAKLLPQLPAAVGVEPGNADLERLEALASFSSSSSSTVAALASAYLERNQPGLASAVIERAPAEVRRQPVIAQLHARSLFQRGRAREALALANEAHNGCVTPATSERCPSWLVAKTARQLAFFSEVVAAGIEDPYTDLSGTKAAYERSAGEVRLVAMR